jgi:hypothetical protein
MKGSISNRIVRDADGNQWCPECGCLLSDVRSHKHLGAFFLFLKHVFENWPEAGAGPDQFVPDNTEHLRAFLLVRSGHVQPSHVFRFANRQEAQWGAGFISELMRADRARGVYGWPQKKEGGIAIIYPASISIYGPNKISEKQFCKVTEAVFKVIYDLTGIDFDEWKEGGGRPARKAA